MDHIHVVPRAHSLAARPARPPHNTVREGIRLGLIVGAATWLWLAGFDVLTGQPFYTLEFLGGPYWFTLVHFTLCLGYGLTVISAVHATMKEPTVMFAIIFSTILFQASVVMLTALLSNIGLGQLAWGKFFLGNAMAAGLTYVLIARNHPMRELYHTAEAHQKD